MKSINEQIKLINLLIEMSQGEEDKFSLEYFISIKHSLLSLKQKTDCNMDFFVAVMHKDTYAKFIEYSENKENEKKENKTS